MTVFYEFMVSKNKHAIFALALASKDLDLEEDYFRSSFRAILHFLTISVANKCDLSSYYQYNGKRYCHLSPHCCFLPPRAAQLRVAQPSKVSLRLIVYGRYSVRLCRPGTQSIGPSRPRFRRPSAHQPSTPDHIRNQPSASLRGLCGLETQSLAPAS